MIFPEKTITLKDGRTAVLRSPRVEDAGQLLRYLKQTAGETEFLLRYPEECCMTIQQEEAFIQNSLDSESGFIICCFVDGILAGNCDLRPHTRLKTRHRANIGIALLKEFWGLGIGTAMFREMIRYSKDNDFFQLELEVFETNLRGLALYRKMGFEIVATTPNAIRLKDGTMLSEHLMVLPLL